MQNTRFCCLYSQNSTKPRKIFDFLTAVFFSIFFFICYIKVYTSPKYYYVFYIWYTVQSVALNVLHYFFFLVDIIFYITHSHIPPINTDNMRITVHFKAKWVLCCARENIFFFSFEKPKIIPNPFSVFCCFHISLLE